MIARRFTIICLLLTLFGMFFASLVAQGRTERDWRQRADIGCAYTTTTTCGTSR